MRSRDRRDGHGTAWKWLLAKETRELAASRAWWLFLAAMGPLVGVSFISAVRTYAEASGLNGTAAGVGEAFSPLIGIWAPTFSACEVAAAFLLPFVAIRLVSGDRQSGALKIELQHPMNPFARIAAKAFVLFAGWLVALLAAAAAIVLWKSYGGSVYPAEVATVVLGHLLNAGLTIALAAATASMAEHPSTAAIMTLTVTVGTWIINFVAAVQGGVWERVAAYTPTAIVADFQHGLIRLDVVLIALTLVAAGLALATVWLRIGVAVRRRIVESTVIGAVTALAIFASARMKESWDTSESRANSFSVADEAALRQIDQPVRIDVHLAPEDPRRFDLERHALSKLRRVMPHLQIQYVSATSIGLFEQTSAHYGEIWYAIGNRQVMSRAISSEAVLESIYSLAGISPEGASPGGSPAGDEDSAFRGHPLAVTPRGAAIVFYGVWPAVVIAAAFVTDWSRS